MSTAATLFRQVPAFAAISPALLDLVERTAEEIAVPGGTAIVREGEPGEHVYLIAAGHAEVSVTTPAGPALLATLAEGELFGEIALLSPEHRRTATVTAATPARLFRLGGVAFRRLLDDTPGAPAAFAEAVRVMGLMRFIKLAASPFAHLDQDKAQWLAQRLAVQPIAPGEAVIRQGEEGDCCYLIRAGRVDISAAGSDGTAHHLATLGPGAMFGESALLTAAPRNSTVTVAEAGELLVLRRADLLQAMGEMPELGAGFRELLETRVRPKRTPGIIVAPGTSRSGEVIAILKDPVRHAYYRLSPEGRFIWDRLDGDTTVKDLILAYFRTFKAFAPQAVIATIAALRDAGFVQPLGLRREAGGPAGPRNRLLDFARTVLEWRLALRGVDGALGWLYHQGGWIAFARVVQPLWIVLSVAGAVLLIADAPRAGRQLEQIGPWVLAWLPLMQAIILVAHEAGHAFATKAVGREVLGAGIGWYWFGPVAFVDTTDTWLATRWERIVVGFAGPYVNLVMAGLAVLAGHVVADPALQAILWQFGFLSFMTCVVNLNPLLEFDGYYMLSDWLDRPNLRRQTLAWLGSGLLPALRSGSAGLRRHWFELLFGASSVLYVLGMGWLSFEVFRLIFAGWFAQLLPPLAAGMVAWLFVALVVTASLARIIGDILGARAAGTPLGSTPM